MRRPSHMSTASNGGSLGTISNNSQHVGTDKNNWLERPSRAVWAIRTSFLLFLVCLAVTLGLLANRIVLESEKEVGKQQFQAVATSALDLGEELVLRRMVVVHSMAQIAAIAFPEATMWPDVAIPAFETIAHDLLDTSGSLELAFYPKVQPEEFVPGEQSSFEEFAYDYFYNQRNPPFRNNTAVFSFGRGVWKAGGPWSGDLAVHDTDGIVWTWDSPYRILFPELQNSNTGLRGRLSLMYNIHSDPTKGKSLDEVIACTDERKKTSNVEMDCGVVSGILSHNRDSFLVHPIYPVKDQSEFTGIIMSRVSWDKIIENMFKDGVANGVHAVLESEGGFYSYFVKDGVAEFSGEGDLHDVRFSKYARTTTIEGTGASSRQYKLTLYPTDEFFDVYSTNNPEIATLGAVLIVVITSLIFILYDFVVRREFSAKQQLLESKRLFMRFVSHEVRTPLNAVCMGLALLQEELEQVLGIAWSTDSSDDEEDGTNFDSDIEVGRCEEASTSTSIEKPVTRSNISNWLSLTEDITNSAKSSVDVLNDLLNYDKIQMGTFNLELTLISIWSLVSETASEFKLAAKKKNISFKVDFSHLETSQDFEKYDSAVLPSKLQHTVVVGDRIRIAQVLRNLISNALKFTSDGGNVTIRVVWTKEKATDRSQPDTFTLVSGEEMELERQGHVEITVIDTGAGLSEEQLAALFQDGVQFNVNELQAGQGSGLGLFISKGIVKQHNGVLKVYSRGLGKGASFCCKLPLHHTADCQSNTERSQESIEDDIEPPKEKVPLQPLRVLVVDDVLTNRKLLARLVRKHDHSCDEAKDGREAIEKVQKAQEEGKPYATILMDCEMPVLRGPDATQEIRQQGCDAFIVGVTGNVLVEDVQHFLSCGANVVLPKPVDFRKLEELWYEHGVVPTA